MNALKIYTQYGWKYCSCGNFGDNLTKFILEKLISCRIEHVLKSDIGKANLIGLGTILDQVPEDYGGMIWGSGFTNTNDYKNFTRANILLVRGEKTLNQIDCPNKSNVIVGEGGLLSYLFIKPNIRKKYKLGIVPHYIDKSCALILKLRSLSDEIKIIDVCDDCKTVIENINQCEYIISSSLHGIVVADSLNIPNEWVKIYKMGQIKQRFKFRDYYSIFGIRRHLPMFLSESDTMDTILHKLQSQRYERKNIEDIKIKILSTIREIKW